MKNIIPLIVLAAVTFCGNIPLRGAEATPSPTLEQRVSSLEAYVQNGDPTAGLKDKDGKIPAGLTTPTVGVPGPGANGWQMTAAALVLFMTLPGLGAVLRRAGSTEECPLRRGAVLLHHGNGHHSLVDLRLQPGVSRA